MPWHIVANHSECSSDKPWAVVKDADGEVEGCHATESDADDQLAALYASESQESQMSETELAVRQEDGVTLGGKPNPGTPRDKRLAKNKKPCPPGQHRMPDGDCMPDEDMLDVDALDLELEAAELTGPFVQWEGVLAVEGVETGDGREFALDSLEWPDPEDVVLPLQWQKESEPKHGRSIVVGRIDQIERQDDGRIWGSGVIKSDAAVTEQIRHGLAGGISVDVDSVRDADVELVFPDADDDRVETDADDVVMLFGPPPEKAIYHRGRLRGATLVALPAFVEAQIRLVDEETDALVAAGVPVNPPYAWFTDPKFDGPTPWHVDDDGRVGGHLALWASCHQTFPDRCITPPRERDYPYFMRSELKTDDGTLVGVGPITMRTGHALDGLGARPAAEHYDNTGTAVVDVAVGEDRYGIWVAGALRSTVTDVQLRELRGAALSGDWRRIGGRLRLVAVLAVNVPGFPIPKMRARVDEDGWSSLVAAGVVTEERASNVREALAHVDDDGTIRVRRVRS